MRTLNHKQPILRLTVRRDEMVKVLSLEIGASLKDEHIVNVHIWQQREKIGLDPSKPEIWLSVPGFGYRKIKQTEELISNFHV